VIKDPTGKRFVSSGKPIAVEELAGHLVIFTFLILAV